IGADGVYRLHLTCLSDPDDSPCGNACRYLACVTARRNRMAVIIPPARQIYFAGKWTVKAAPLPGSELIESQALCRVSMCLTIASPSPVPFWARLVSASTR